MAYHQPTPMFAYFPKPRFMPCPECGESLAESDQNEHVCSEERVIEFRVIQLRPELDALEHELAEYLDTPQGKFDLWCAEHHRAA